MIVFVHVSYSTSGIDNPPNYIRCLIGSDCNSIVPYLQTRGHTCHHALRWLNIEIFIKFHAYVISMEIKKLARYKPFVTMTYTRTIPSIRHWPLYNIWYYIKVSGIRQPRTKAFYSALAWVRGCGTHANSDATKIFYFLNKTAYISVFGDLY